MVVILAGEERLAAKHLGQNAADRPHVDGLGVLLESKHDFRCTIPASGDVFGHETLVVLGTGGGTCETEIADLQIAIRVEEQVRRLEITVEDVGGVHSLKCAESLVDKVLAVVVRKLLCADDTVHVRLHKLLDEVDLSKALVVARLLDVEDGNDVFVVEVAQQLHLTECAKTEHGTVQLGQ